jgi:hypothetical protein
VIFHLVSGGVTHLQYADDSDEVIDLGIVNLKILLLFFECMSGLKINFDREKCMVVTWVMPREKHSVAHMLNFKLGEKRMLADMKRRAGRR